MILRVRGGQQVEYRALTLLDLPRYGVTTGLRGSYGGVSARTAAGVPAIHRAARIRAEALASLQLGVYRGEGIQKTEATVRTWQAELFSRQRMNEYQTRFAFWEAIEESLAYRGNAYAWKLRDPETGIVLALFALHPDQVTCRGMGAYTVKVDPGYIDPVGQGRGKYEVDEATILHIRGFGDGGADKAPSPMEVFRQTISSTLARQRHEARVWEKGLSLQLGVEFPVGMTPEKAKDWRDLFERDYGPDGHTTAVVGGGAVLKPIGMTMEDAQFVELAKLTGEDAARMMGVPFNLLRPPEREPAGAFENDLAYWLRFGIGPELFRIESALAADDDLFPVTDLRPEFKTQNFIRGDLLTEANIMHQRIQDGTITPDEGRAELGYPPHPGGVGAVPQITPVGGAPNTPTPATVNGTQPDSGY